MPETKKNTAISRTSSILGIPAARSIGRRETAGAAGFGSGGVFGCCISGGFCVFGGFCTSERFCASALFDGAGDCAGCFCGSCFTVCFFAILITSKIQSILIFVFFEVFLTQFYRTSFIITYYQKKSNWFHAQFAYAYPVNFRKCPRGLPAYNILSEKKQLVSRPICICVSGEL